jgi:hypothetical protein
LKIVVGSSFYSCGRQERRFEPSFGNRKLGQSRPAATDPPALIGPPDAAAAVGTIFDHLFPGFYIQNLRQFRAFFFGNFFFPERAVFVTFEVQDKRHRYGTFRREFDFFAKKKKP